MEQVFSAGNSLALAGWVLLLVLPRWRGVANVVAGVLVPGLLAFAYLVLVAMWWSRGAGGFGSIAEVRALFTSDPVLVAGWFHYLAFDLFVGAWINREAQRVGIAHAIVVPLLLLTFLFGPIGYVSFLAVRAIWQGTGEGVLERAPLRAARRWLAFVAGEPFLVRLGLIFLVSMVPMLVAAGFDDRLINGVNVWTKPLKFALSLGLFSLTLALFMPMASAAFRKTIAGRYVVYGFAIPAILELAYIAWRASRGEPSHFNLSTPLSSALYSAMGIGAILLTASAPVLAYGLMRRDAPPADPTIRLAVVLGLVLTFVIGVPAAAIMGAQLGHAVGVPAAGDTGIVFFGWLRTAGDLRVSHFLGIHAQQIVPAFGLLVAVLLPRLGRPLVWGFAILFSALTIGVLVQALAGLPVLPL